MGRSRVPECAEQQSDVIFLQSVRNRRWVQSSEEKVHVLLRQMLMPLRLQCWTAIDLKASFRHVACLHLSHPSLQLPIRLLPFLQKEQQTYQTYQRYMSVSSNK